MTHVITISVCLTTFVTFSRINAKIIPNIQTDLKHKLSDMEKFLHNNYNLHTNFDVYRWKTPFSNSGISASSYFQKPYEPVMPSSFETRTEILPLSEGNVIRYYLSETSSLPSQPWNNSFREDQAKNILSGIDSHSVLNDTEKKISQDKSVVFPSGPTTITFLKDFKNPSFSQSPLKQFSDSQRGEASNLFGLSYLNAEEAKDLTKEPLETPEEIRAPKGSTKLASDYQQYYSDSTESYSFPRFNIPLKSLQLESAQSKDFNTETSEIIDPTFIVPAGSKITHELIPRPSSPIVTYGVSIGDEEFSRKEIRKDNGEFFSSYRNSDVSSADVGSLVPTADGGQVLVLRGSHSFTSPEGLRFRSDYTADDTGYHVTQITT